MFAFVLSIKVKPVKPEWAPESVFNASLQAAALDELLCNARYSARVVHDREQGRCVYWPADDGTFTVEMYDADRLAQVVLMVRSLGFEIVPQDDDEVRTFSDSAVDGFVGELAARTTHLGPSREVIDLEEHEGHAEDCSLCCS